MSEHYTKI